MKIKVYIKNNIKKLRWILFIYNYFFGRNRLLLRGSNRLELGSAKLDNFRIRIKGENNLIIIKDLCRLRKCTVTILGNNNRVFIGTGSVAEQTDFYIEDDNNTISIGDAAVLFGPIHLAAMESTNLDIGQECIIASDGHFRTGDSHSILNKEGDRINPSEDIVIGKHVWIGTRVLVLKGTVVADQCMIGACTLLSGKYNESNTLIAGNPSKVIKKDIEWVRERIQTFGGNNL